MLLVDRGGCYFALKTWHAQQAGAAAVLVADSVEEPLLTMDTPEEETPDMAFLANITAPSALVSKPFGDALRAAASDSGGAEVVVTPGERLGPSSSLEAGRGAYADGRSVRASVTGRRRFVAPAPGSSDQVGFT